MTQSAESRGDMIADPDPLHVSPKGVEPSEDRGGPITAPGIVEAVGILHALPKEMGVVLISAGVIGFLLPGPGAPALIAGGLVLWPGRFGKVEGWFRSRYPDLHRAGIGHVGRFLSDLERRYPGSIR
jgi:hypothetical protein